MRMKTIFLGCFSVIVFIFYTLGWGQAETIDPVGFSNLNVVSSAISQNHSRIFLLILDAFFDQKDPFVISQPVVNGKVLALPRFHKLVGVSAGDFFFCSMAAHDNGQKLLLSDGDRIFSFVLTQEVASAANTGTIPRGFDYKLDKIFDSAQILGQITELFSDDQSANHFFAITEEGGRVRDFSLDESGVTVVPGALSKAFLTKIVGGSKFQDTIFLLQSDERVIATSTDLNSIKNNILFSLATQSESLNAVPSSDVVALAGDRLGISAGLCLLGGPIDCTSGEPETILKVFACVDQKTGLDQFFRNNTGQLIFSDSVIDPGKVSGFFRFPIPIQCCPEPLPEPEPEPLPEPGPAQDIQEVFPAVCINGVAVTPQQKANLTSGRTITNDVVTVGEATFTTADKTGLRIPILVNFIFKATDPLNEVSSKNFVFSGSNLNPTIPNGFKFIGQISSPVSFFNAPDGKISSAGSAFSQLALLMNPDGRTGFLTVPIAQGDVTTGIVVTQDGAAKADVLPRIGDRVSFITCGADAAAVAAPPPPAPAPKECAPGEIRQEVIPSTVNKLRQGVEAISVSNLSGLRGVSNAETVKMINGMREATHNAFLAGEVVTIIGKAISTTPQVFLSEAATNELFFGQPEVAYLRFQQAAADAILVEIARLAPILRGAYLDADVDIGRLWEKSVRADIETTKTSTCNQDGKFDPPNEVSTVKVTQGPCVFTTNGIATLKREFDFPVIIDPRNPAKATAIAVRKALTDIRRNVLSGREIGFCVE